MDCETCRYIPELYRSFVDKNGNNIETNDPADACEFFECDKCGFAVPFGYIDDTWFEPHYPYKARFNYCPNCGRKLINYLEWL